MIAGEINNKIQGDNEAAANRLAAEGAFRTDVTALVTRLTEERIAAGLQLEDVGQQGEALRSRAITSAAEAGVSGISVDLLSGDIERQEAEERSLIGRSLLQVEGQLSRELDAAEATRDSRIAGRPGPSGVGTLLGIGAGALSGVRSAESRRGPRVKKIKPPQTSESA